MLWDRTQCHLPEEPPLYKHATSTRGQTISTKATSSPQRQSQGVFLRWSLLRWFTYTTRDQRISTRGQIVAKKFCAIVKMVAKQSTTVYHNADSIARCLRRNTPSSLGTARSFYSNTMSCSVARSLCRNTPPSPAVTCTAYSTVTPRHRTVPLQKHRHCHPQSHFPSIETRRCHPASHGHSTVTPHQMSGGKSNIYGGGAHATRKMTSVVIRTRQSPRWLTSPRWQKRCRQPLYDNSRTVSTYGAANNNKTTQFITQKA